MTTEPVRFHQDPEALAYLRARGIDPNTLAKEAFQARLRGLRARESADGLERVQARLSRPVEALVREDRDHGHGPDGRDDGDERGP